MLEDVFKDFSQAIRVKLNGENLLQVERVLHTLGLFSNRRCFWLLLRHIICRKRVKPVDIIN